MKIGILTLPLHTNYGGILQAYALQTVLERMGHDASLIEKKWKPARLPLWKVPLSYGKRILKNLTGHPFPILYEQKMNCETPIVRQYTDKFINKYIKRRIVDDYSDIKETDFDVIVVGSDQVWRPKYFHEIEHAYLDFTKGWDIKRIAYAASFGKDEWEYTGIQTKRCGDLLKHFNAVSVREDSGVALCREYFSVKAWYVLDPTMMLRKEEYIQLFENASIQKNRGNLLCYILDESPQKTDLINRIAEEMKLFPFFINSKNDINLPIEKRIAFPVEQWLRGFFDAEFVITDSFHACVFSILFNKPFIVVGNTERGMSRFTSLLSTFGLEGRLIEDESLYNKTDEQIDWKMVNLVLDSKRKYSETFLINSLTKTI